MTKHYPPTYHQYLLENRHNELVMYARLITRSRNIAIIKRPDGHIGYAYKSGFVIERGKFNIVNFESWLNIWEANNPLVGQPQPLAYTQQEAKDKYFNQLAAEIRELEQAARAERKSSRQPQLAPVNAKSIQSIHTRSSSTELAIQNFMSELEALGNDLPLLAGALENLQDAFESVQGARICLAIYLDANIDSERVPNGSAE